MFAFTLHTFPVEMALLTCISIKLSYTMFVDFRTNSDLFRTVYSETSVLYIYKLGLRPFRKKVIYSAHES